MFSRELSQGIDFDECTAFPGFSAERQTGTANQTVKTINMNIDFRIRSIAGTFDMSITQLPLGIEIPFVINWVLS